MHENRPDLDVARLLTQDLAVQRLRLWQPARLVMLECGAGIVPDVVGEPARMMLLSAEPGGPRLFVNDMRGPLYSVADNGKQATYFARWAGSRGDTSPWSAPATLAIAEDLGYDSFWTAEAYGSDALTPLAWWGASTSRIKLGQMCTAMSYRNPVYLAKVAATVDIISGGNGQPREIVLPTHLVVRQSLLDGLETIFGDRQVGLRSGQLDSALHLGIGIDLDALGLHPGASASILES